MTNKFFVLRDVRRIFKRIDAAAAMPEGMLALQAMRECRRDSRSLVEHVYGKDVDLAIAMGEVDIDFPVDFNADGEPVQYDDEMRVLALANESLSSLLSEFEVGIVKNGLPPGFRHSGWARVREDILVAGLGVLAGFVLAFLLRQWLPISASTVQHDAQVRVETLRSWYKGDNRQFEKALAGLTRDQQKRGIYESGVAIGEVIRFGEDWRAKRDQTIDTAFARLESMSVRTDTLGINRKLPISLKSFVTPRLKRSNLQEWDLNGSGIDTL